MLVQIEKVCIFKFSNNPSLSEHPKRVVLAKCKFSDPYIRTPGSQTPGVGPRNVIFINHPKVILTYVKFWEPLHCTVHPTNSDYILQNWFCCPVYLRQDLDLLHHYDITMDKLLKIVSAFTFFSYGVGVEFSFKTIFLLSY